MKATFAFALALGACIVGYSASNYFGASPSRAHATVRVATVDSDRAVRQSDDSGELRQQIADLSAQMAALRAELSTRAPANPAPPVTDVPPGPPDAVTAAKVREERRAYVAGIEADFFNESRDAKWSTATFTAIHQAVDTQALRDVLRSVECRSQTCRVELTNDGKADLGKKLLPLVNQLGSSLPEVEYDHVDDGNGHRSVILYMSKGDAMPVEVAQAVSKTATK